MVENYLGMKEALQNLFSVTIRNSRWNMETRKTCFDHLQVKLFLQQSAEALSSCVHVGKMHGLSKRQLISWQMASITMFVFVCVCDLWIMFDQSNSKFSAITRKHSQQREPGGHTMREGVELCFKQKNRKKRLDLKYKITGLVGWTNYAYLVVETDNW